MQNFLTIFWIILPLLIGYLLNVSDKNSYYKIADKLLMFSLSVILFVTGVSITNIDHLGTEIFKILYYAGFLLFVTLALNIFVMLLYDKKIGYKVLNSNNTTILQWKVIFSSLKQVSWVVLGVILGFTVPQLVPYVDSLTKILLMLLFFIIGLQLRSSGIKIIDVLLNRKGLQLSILFILSCGVAAWLVSIFLSLPIRETLAANSGFGWYSMSGGLVTQIYGPFWGAIVLVNDLGREIMAFILVPILMKFSPSASIAVCGSTSADFTLPAIKKVGDIGIVPVAVSFGFITTVLAPFLMVIFASM